MTDPTARFRLGLCSVTFRQLSPAEVIARAADAGLTGIEWGADRHAPAADPDTTADVGRLTRTHGLACRSYGSYWRAGVDSDADLDAVLASARALPTERIRIWAGPRGSADAGADGRAAVVTATRRAAQRAAELRLELAFEFHGGTLTDTAESTVRLLDEVDEANVSTYWQPPQDVSPAEAIAGLTTVLDRVSAVHVFSWWPGTTRLRLRERADLWIPALDVLAERNQPLDLLMEFVPDDDPALLPAEVATLRAWLTPD